MFEFFTKKKKWVTVRTVAKKQLKDNKAVFKSLRDYDAGKKEISIDNVRRNLQAVQSAS